MAEKRHKKQQEAERRKAKGIEEKDDENDSDDEEEEEEELIRHDQGNVLKCFYSNEPNKFMITMVIYLNVFFQAFSRGY